MFSDWHEDPHCQSDWSLAIDVDVFDRVLVAAAVPQNAELKLGYF